MLLELPIVKAHLVVIHDADDELIKLYMAAAQDFIEQYLGRPVPWNDDAGAPVEVPESVKLAALLLVGDSYAVREGSITGTIHKDNPVVLRLLSLYRVDWGV